VARGIVDEEGGGGSPPGDSTPVGTTPLQRDDRRVVVQRFRLTVADGVDRGAECVTTSERTVIGTSPTADLVLTDPTVSRFHSEIVLVDGRVSIRDLQSRNGTLVNGVSVLAAHLAVGSLIRLGNSTVRFDLDADVVELPLSQRRRFGLLVGGSLAMRRVFAVLERAAATDSTVLIEGETGTGKEAVAESIHRESARHAAPFVVVDCAAIPVNLIESELFGHERGSFTGAAGAREGAFEAANGGTIFLDEVGELASELQPKLLRVIERREVKRLGAARYQPIDVRVLAATNRNLRAEVNAHRFRSDLFFRLAVLEVRLPPLRERLDDLPALVEHLLEVFGRRDDPQAAFVREPDFVDALAGHAWPGNVRELRNHLERCLALHERAPLAASSAAAEDWPIDLDRSLRDVRDGAARIIERRYLEAVLERHERNITAAARASGIDRIHFYRLLARHGLR
jgi:transcriptional regulator with PAS, ATPase and Fis domain